MKRVGWMIGLLAVVAATAAAQVTLSQRPDGTRVMSNSGRSTGGDRGRINGSVGAVVAAEWLLDRRLDLNDLIERHAEESQLDPDLVHAVIQAESAYDPQARSTKGAMGLMQLMPGTARALGVDDPWDAEQNIDGGTRYLRQMLDQFDDRLDWALAAYNAGPETIQRYQGVPPWAETRAYVDRVLGIYHGEVEGTGRGRKVYLTRGSEGVLMMTTRPPRP